MAKDISDRRVQKTRQLLQDSLISLISEKGFEAVSIQDILDRANVGRSTFYLHFENKQELLHSCFKDFIDLFEQYNERANQKHDPNDAELMVHLLRFVAKNHRLFKVLLGKYGIPMFSLAVQEYALAYFSSMVKQSAANKGLSSIQHEMMSHYFASAFVGMLKWWIDKDMPCSAEELDNYFRQLSMFDVFK